MAKFFDTQRGIGHGHSETEYREPPPPPPEAFNYEEREFIKQAILSYTSSGYDNEVSRAHTLLKDLNKLEEEVLLANQIIEEQLGEEEPSEEKREAIESEKEYEDEVRQQLSDEEEVETSEYELGEKD